MHVTNDIKTEVLENNNDNNELFLRSATNGAGTSGKNEISVKYLDGIILIPQCC